VAAEQPAGWGGPAGAEEVECVGRSQKTKRELMKISTSCRYEHILRDELGVRPLLNVLLGIRY
jgi:hypothetical protein